MKITLRRLWSAHALPVFKNTQIVQDTLHLTVDTVYFLHRTDVYK